MNNILKLKVARWLYRISSRSVLRNSGIRHYLPSLIYSKEDMNTSSYLVEVLSKASITASKNILSCGKKNLHDSKFLNIFPGEHYRLINALVKVINAKEIVEIGTFTGLGSLSLQEGNPQVNITTYDIIPWDKLHLPSHFVKTDFKNKNIRQIIGDLSQDNFFKSNKDILDKADLIFLDAPKDDVFEYIMAKNLTKLNKKKSKLLVIDDINFINMIDFWREIKSPKIDATSFGHFSGTGVVDISDGFRFGRKNF